MRLDNTSGRNRFADRVPSSALGPGKGGCYIGQISIKSLSGERIFCSTRARLDSSGELLD
jgi:hypothetical protein